MAKKIVQKRKTSHKGNRNIIKSIAIIVLIIVFLAFMIVPLFMGPKIV